MYVAVIAVTLATLGVLSYGCWLAYPPAGFIVPSCFVWYDLRRLGSK